MRAKRSKTRNNVEVAAQRPLLPADAVLNQIDMLLQHLKGAAFAATMHGGGPSVGTHACRATASGEREATGMRQR